MFVRQESSFPSRPLSLTRHSLNCISCVNMVDNIVCELESNSFFFFLVFFSLAVPPHLHRMQNPERKDTSFDNCNQLCWLDVRELALSQPSDFGKMECACQASFQPYKKKKKRSLPSCLLLSSHRPAALEQSLRRKGCLLPLVAVSPVQQLERKLMAKHIFTFKNQEIRQYDRHSKRPDETGNFIKNQRKGNHMQGVSSGICSS